MPNKCQFHKPKFTKESLIKCMILMLAWTADNGACWLSPMRKCPSLALDVACKAVCLTAFDASSAPSYVVPRRVKMGSELCFGSKG